MKSFLGFPRTQLHWGAVLSFKHLSPSKTISICKKRKYFQQLREVVKYNIFYRVVSKRRKVPLLFWPIVFCLRSLPFDSLFYLCKFSGLCSFICVWMKRHFRTKCTDRKLSANGLVLMAWSVLFNFLSRHILGPDPAGISWFEYMKVFRRLWRLCCYFEESVEVGTGWLTEPTTGGEDNYCKRGMAEGYNWGDT